MRGGEPLDDLLERPVEPPAGGAVRAHRKTEGATGQHRRLGDQQGEAGAVGGDRQAVQEVSAVVVRLAGGARDGLRSQVRDVLAHVLGLPAGQSAKADPVPEDRLIRPTSGVLGRPRRGTPALRSPRGPRRRRRTRHGCRGRRLQGADLLRRTHPRTARPRLRRGTAGGKTIWAKQLLTDGGLVDGRHRGHRAAPQSG